MPIGKIIELALTVFAYFFNPEARRKRERTSIWNKMKKLESEYAAALLAGDPQKAARVDSEMRAYREKLRYIGGS